MALTVNKKEFCVLEFATTESIVTVQRRFRIMYHREPPTDKTIRERYMKFQQSACLCAAKRRGRPGPSAETVERVRETFVRGLQKATTQREPGIAGRTETWRDSLPIDMLLSAVSVLVVAQSSSEIPEGVMNNPYFGYILVYSEIFSYVIEILL